MPASIQVDAIFCDISAHKSGSSEFLVMQLMGKDEESSKVLNR
jgi:hypothetical protein